MESVFGLAGPSFYDFEPAKIATSTKELAKIVLSRRAGRPTRHKHTQNRPFAPPKSAQPGVQREHRQPLPVPFTTDSELLSALQ